MKLCDFLANVFDREKPEGELGLTYEAASLALSILWVKGAKLTAQERANSKIVREALCDVRNEAWLLVDLTKS